MEEKKKKNHCNKTLAAAAAVNDTDPYCNEYSLSTPYADLFNFSNRI